jgi:O-antigen/teichoic acid export membrane protein
MVDAKALIRLWVGGRMQIVAMTFAILILGNLFSQIALPTYFVVVGKGVLRPGVVAAAIACGLNVILSYFFITRWGFAGAALGTALPMIISTMYFFLACRRHFLNPVFRTLRGAYLKPVLCSLVAAAPIPIVDSLRVSIWWGVLAEVILFSGVYLAGLVFTKCIDRKDITMVARQFPFLSRRRVGIEPAQMGELL